MTSSVGQINFGVGVDADNLTTRLRLAVEPAVAAVQRELNRNPLKIKLDVDTFGAEAKIREVTRKVRTVKAKLDIDVFAAEAAIREITRKTRTVKIKFDVDLTETQVKNLRAAATAISKLESKVVKVEFSSDITDAQVKNLRGAASAISKLESKVVKVEFSSNLTEDQVRALRGAASAIRRLESKNIVINVVINVDEARLARLAEVLRNLRDRNLRVGVRTDSGPVERLAAALGRLSKYVGIGALIAAGLAAIGGAAGAALGAVGGLVAGLGALGGALGAIGATAVVGFQGIGDAFKSLSAITDNAVSEGKSQAATIKAAYNALDNAQESVQDSSASLTRAQREQASAAEDVADAYGAAQKRLDGYVTSLKEANLDEREAALNLVEAQNALNTGFGSDDPLERTRKLQAVERAEINLTKAQEANKDLQEEARTAHEKGIDQADEVVEARERQARADLAVEEAQRNLQRSIASVAEAQANLAEAQNANTTSADKYAQALANLSPAARNFVETYRGLQPVLEDFRKGIQERVFAGLGEQLSETANVVLPVLSERMGGVADQLNAAATNAFEFLRSEEGIRGLNILFANGELLLKGLTGGTGEFTKGMIDLQAAALPTMEGLGRAIASIGEGIGRAFSDSAASGQLTRVFEGLNTALTGLGKGLDPFIGGLLTLAEKVLPTLGPFFETFGNVIEKIAPSLGDLGAVFVNSLTLILPYLGGFIQELAIGLKPLLPVISKLIGTLAVALGPLVEPLSRIAIIFGETLIEVIEKLSPALEPLATAFADVLEALAPIIPLIAENLANVILALAPAISEVAKALAPVVQIFVDEMTPVMRELAPVMAEVAGILGKALADALIQIAPILPDLIRSFTGLMLALTPLLPEFAKLAAEILPPLIDVLVQVSPILVRMMELFTDLVDRVIVPILIPVIRQLGEIFSEQAQDIADGVEWVTDTVFPALGRALDTLKGWFSSAVSGIETVWAGLQNATAVPINFVIETVWNNGLLKAWNAVDDMLGGALPNAVKLDPIPRRATGGSVGYLHGGGNGTKDDILTWLSNGEHVVTAAEVVAAGGQNVLLAIRDMIFRGIPFTWDNGNLITELGRDNLSRYGAAVGQKGFGNVPPEGLFDPLATVPIPKFEQGGPIFPWMHQLKAGHDFARAQDGRRYQWAGPRFVGDSFDCSGFMASIIAAITGSNVWQRYWATSTFAGYPAVGAQGLVKGLRDGVGMLVGITDDPGGAGGGHTAGELRGIPEMGIPAARVESGGNESTVKYGKGTPVTSFASLYGLPIGANGFFEPSFGGVSASGSGPSVAQQNSVIADTIGRIIRAVTEPIGSQIVSSFGQSPTGVNAIPAAALGVTEKVFTETAVKAVDGLGGLVGAVWQRTQDIGDRVLDFVNPFDSGGIASGTGFMPKNVIAPERVLSPEQTELFEALVVALQRLATGSASAIGAAASAITVDLSRASVDALRVTAAADSARTAEETQDVIERTASSQEEVAAREAAAQREQLFAIASRLGGDVLGPIMASAVDAGVGVLNSLIEGLGTDVVRAINGTTRAVNDLNADTTGADTSGIPAVPSFGQPGSAFNFPEALSSAVTTVANAASAAFEKVRDDIVNAALAQTPSRVGGQSRGRLGEDVSGGYLTDLVVRLTGVEIEILDLLENTYEEIQSFREGAFSGFDESGQLISDTAALIQRNQSSIELAASEQERIQKALIKSVIKYLITSVLIPIITAVLGAMITLATTAIGAAVGSAIPVIGTAIGAAIGAAVGAALTGLAAVFTSLLAVGAGAALDAFDSGGVAQGTGYMPKNVIAPERVLSPRQTAAFETLVSVLDGRSAGNRTVSIGNMNITGSDSARKTSDRLLDLLNAP